jgi:hypothetical protein
VWRLIGFALVAGYIIVGVGGCSLTNWTYFDLGWEWTGDAVVPQIQGVLVFIGMSLSALVFVPPSLPKQSPDSKSFPITFAWPLPYAAFPFVGQNIGIWGLLGFAWGALGVVLLRKAGRRPVI